jgi:type VI secretion system secreted protein Hcp
MCHTSQDEVAEMQQMNTLGQVAPRSVNVGDAGGAVDMFVKITGRKQGVIKGESEDAKHIGEIDAESYHWGVVQGFSTNGLPTGKRQYGKFTFVMRSQIATPKLLSACATNESLTEVLITCRKAGGTQQEYIKWTLTNASVAEVNSGYLFSGQLIPYDEVSLVFQKIQLEYRPQKADGTLGAGVIFSDDMSMSV